MREVVEFDLDPAILERFSKLPPKSAHVPAKIPTDWQKDIIRLFWNSKRHTDLAREFGICKSTLLKWKDIVEREDSDEIPANR